MVEAGNKVTENAGALEGYLSMSRTHTMADQTSSPYGILNIVSTLAWGWGILVCLISSAFYGNQR